MWKSLPLGEMRIKTSILLSTRGSSSSSFLYWNARASHRQYKYSNTPSWRHRNVNQRAAPVLEEHMSAAAWLLLCLLLCSHHRELAPTSTESSAWRFYCNENGFSHVNKESRNFGSSVPSFSYIKKVLEFEEIIAQNVQFPKNLVPCKFKKHDFLTHAIIIYNDLT